MASIKPEIKIESVFFLLKNVLDMRVDGLDEINTGRIARTFMFASGEKEWFIQFTASNMSQGFRTESHYAHQFRKHGVPVRSVFSTGACEGLDYLISGKVGGRGFHENGREEFIGTLPSVVSVLANISEIEITNTEGFGWLNGEMNGTFASWPAHLLQIRDEEPGRFYDNWHHLFETTFLEREAFDRYYLKMEKLFPFLIDVRNLLHGGFGYGNVLTLDRRVTAILDWQDARYGDPLFDLAYMTFWHEPELAQIITNEYQKRFIDFDFARENFWSRLACYLYYIGLDGMRFSAMTNDILFYRSVLKVLERITP